MGGGPPLFKIFQFLPHPPPPPLKGGGCRFDGEKNGERTQHPEKVPWKVEESRILIGQKSPFGEVKLPVQECISLKLLIRLAKSWKKTMVRQNRLLNQKKAPLHEQAQQNELGREMQRGILHVLVCLCGSCIHVSKVLTSKPAQSRNQTRFVFPHLPGEGC